MVANNHDSTRYTEEELWSQLFALSKELQDCKACLYPDTLDAIYDKIERIERKMEILLDILQICDK